MTAAGPSPSVPAAADRRHYLGLDGLRGVAALSVAIMHAGTWFSGRGALPHAYLAVDFFFILSGFVIAYAYEARLRDGRIGLRRFAAVRAVRLYPLVVLGAAVAGAFLLLRWRTHADIDLKSILLAVAGGATLVPTFAPSPVAPGVFPLNGPLWSLVYELAINLLYAATVRWWTVPRLAVATAACAAALAWTALQAGSLDVGWLPKDFWGGAPRVGFGFFAGVLIFRGLARMGPQRAAPGLLVLTAALLAVFAIPRWPGLGALVDLACVLGLFPLVVVWGAQREPRGRLATIGRVSGALSYPVYVLHRPLIWWLTGAYNTAHLDARLGSPGRGLLAVGVILSASWLALKLYDEPLRRRLGRGLRA